MDASRIFRRQLNTDSNDDPDTYDGYWWYSTTAYAIKWAVIASLLVLFFLFFLGGYLHARRRMRKGLPPLAYHRWLVPRSQRIAFAQRYPQYAHQAGFYRTTQTPYGHGHAYPMGAYGPPPPAYHEPDYVPAYTPQAPNKVDPDQNKQFVPPYGPPPSNVAAGLGEPSQPARAFSPSGR
ncbi:hypothetical protein LTR10_017946 [Elasticomyces elasticus]|uniref:Ubiquitin-protein ligase sel1 n=1 Tax=Exophiala sideris TaxID=1016849 RepID=A0ABR0IWJ6_9EURO|nr:hypothetical protein LTR10_017946 [Elasticomyces elasticus]KAK5021762.1 hypothetical protein LTS07_010657 [Exophiala sideris]KAK5025878.1 hypothetical protein LTR13_010342 [Exophiala sideris]KAK5050242.1 hypothetical protein LTR69_010730 [Exophiala sideris]KAK5176999.1 hypothetical protein LTR44_010436 [Eurotiomycetes sp. CCFEE 6388]